ncbi:alcohol dehydrogenase [Stemphylium lycopersici]|uniref:GroES-like protein n=1 Tax=Stemphylium lycopersici TaxID=183478 RepID=A0A364N561_STELY|nr:alcohol dehydrogenase [Stemphylium lycopersici]RAR12143.1 GroES-like protein [Stemphylium lycopersici]
MPRPTLPESNTSLTYTTPSSPPHLTHTPLPIPAPNQVLVKIHAAAINPVDIQLWGNPVIGWLAGSKEKGIGRDYSGEIVAVGEELRGKGRWEVGDEVFGLCNRPMAEGTFTHFLAITPSTDPVAKKPSSLPHTTAAAIPLVALTAYACLDWLPPAHLSPNCNSDTATDNRRHIIIAGASGGVGTYCLQLARRLHNCHITAICSSANASFVRSLGADTVIDYTTHDVPATLLSQRPGRGDNDSGKYDLYIDCVGGTHMFDYWTQLLHPQAAYVTIVGDKTARTSMGGPLTYFTYPRQVARYVWGWLRGPRYANVLLFQKSELLDQVAGLVDMGEVKVEVQDVVKGILDEGGCEEAWDKVLAYMVGGRVRGKIVVDLEG